MSNPETRFSSAHAINTCIPLFFCRTQNTFSSIPVAAQCFQVADEALVFCPFHGRAFEEHPITLHVQSHPVLLLHLQQFGTGSEGRWREARNASEDRHAGNGRNRRNKDTSEQPPLRESRPGSRWSGSSGSGRHPVRVLLPRPVWGRLRYNGGKCRNGRWGKAHRRHQQAG